MGLKSVKRKIKRAIDYAIFSWNNEDWDDYLLDDIVLFKLKRLLKDMEAFPYLDKSDSSLKTLKFCIKLLEMVQNEHFDYPMNKHDKKWGTLTIDSKPSEQEGYYELIFTREKATTPGLKEREQAQMGEAFNRGLRLKEKYTNLVYKIIMKHKQTWWT